MAKFDADPKGYVADRIDRELRDELRTNSAFMRRLIHDVDAIVLANSVRALLKERDQRSPHFPLAFALREAFDKHVEARFIPRYNSLRRQAKEKAA